MNQQELFEYGGSLATYAYLQKTDFTHFKQLLDFFMFTLIKVGTRFIYLPALQVNILRKRTIHGFRPLKQFPKLQEKIDQLAKSDEFVYLTLEDLTVGLITAVSTNLTRIGSKQFYRVLLNATTASQIGKIGSQIFESFLKPDPAINNL